MLSHCAAALGLKYSKSWPWPDPLTTAKNQCGPWVSVIPLENSIIFDTTAIAFSVLDKRVTPMTPSQSLQVRCTSSIQSHLRWLSTYCTVHAKFGAAPGPSHSISQFFTLIGEWTVHYQCVSDPLGSEGCAVMLQDTQRWIVWMLRAFAKR